MGRHGQVTGVITGKCHSVAVPILETCQKRLILPCGTLFFHSIAVDDINVLDCVNGNNNKIDEAYSKQLAVEHLIAKRCKQKPALIRQFCEEEKIVSAEEALELGLVDRILNFSIP